MMNSFLNSNSLAVTFEEYHDWSNKSHDIGKEGVIASKIELRSPLAT